ncbi:hypothetical protein, partial [Neotamlana laminarinivorans]
CQIQILSSFFSEIIQSFKFFRNQKFLKFGIFRRMSERYDLQRVCISLVALEIREDFQIKKLR